MKKPGILLIFLGLYLITALSCYGLNIDIIYPQNNSIINARSTFVIGNAPEAEKIFINDQKVRLYEKNIFVKVVPLKIGKNTVEIIAKSKNKAVTQGLTLNVPQPIQSFSSEGLKIDPLLWKPKGENIFTVGETIAVQFQGTPGKNASFSLGNINIPMTEPDPQIPKSFYSFGRQVNVQGQPVKGIYYGTYTVHKLAAGAKNVHPKLHLSDGKGRTKTVEVKNATITIHPELMLSVGEVIQDDAVVRIGKSRTTPLPKGVRLALIGKQDNQYKFSMGKMKSGWIEDKLIKILPKGTPEPSSIVRIIYVKPQNGYTDVEIPLQAKLPFEVQQDIYLKQLVLNIYGATPDTDFIDYKPKDDLVKSVQWEYPSDNNYQVKIYVKQEQQWGYSVFYQGNTLVLRIKKSPSIAKAKPMHNKVIVIDPGHGGIEKGSVGPGGVMEKDINLAISKKLKGHLEKAGAKVILTRAFDQYLDVYDRPKIAQKYDGDVLVSIHCNALPDGRDPYEEYGTTTFYYHSQALPLARAIQKNLVQDLGSKDYGMMYNNLVLTRPYQLPSVLVEVGFMINPDEYLKLITDSYQDKAAVAIMNGIQDFFLQSL